MLDFLLFTLGTAWFLFQLITLMRWALSSKSRLKIMQSNYWPYLVISTFAVPICILLGYDLSMKMWLGAWTISFIMTVLINERKRYLNDLITGRGR